MNTELDPHHPLGPSDAQIARMRTNVHATIATDHTRTRRHRGWTIGGTLGLLVILAGGTSVAMAAGVLQTPPWLTAAPTPTPTATHEPVTVTTPTPTPTATPVPTPTASAMPVAPPPQPRVPLSCDQLVTPADRTVVLGAGSQASHVEDAPYVIGSPQALDGLNSYDAQLAAEPLRCEWASASVANVMFVSVTPLDAVMPDEEPDSTATVQQAPAQLGDKSRLMVEQDGAVLLQFMTTSVEVEIYLEPHRGTAVSAAGSSAGTDAIANLGVTIHSRLAQAKPLAPPYAAPAQLRHVACDAIASAVTAKPGTGILHGEYTAYFDYTSIGGQECSLVHTDAEGRNRADVQMAYLPGGTWDLDRIQSMDSGPLKLTAAYGLGDKALVGCVASDGPGGGPTCWVHLFENEAWLDVSVGTADQGEAIAIAQSIQNGITELAR